MSHEQRPLIALDSDGSVFPNMPLKFAAMRDALIEVFELAAVAAAAEDVVRFVNLNSRWRGRHRFLLLVKVFELLPSHPAVRGVTIRLPDPSPLRAYLQEGGGLSDDALAAAAGGKPFLSRTLAWSQSLSARLAAIPPVTPVAEAEAALRELSAQATWVVISQAPSAQLVREWTAAGLDRFVAAIWGSEAGSKERQIAAAAGQWSPPAGALFVVGDAYGDLEAARKTGAAFIPILPAREAESWRRLRDDLWPDIRDGRPPPWLDGLEREFLVALPEQPPWASDEPG